MDHIYHACKSMTEELVISNVPLIAAPVNHKVMHFEVRLTGLPLTFKWKVFCYSCFFLPEHIAYSAVKFNKLTATLSQVCQNIFWKTQEMR